MNYFILFGLLLNISETLEKCTDIVERPDVNITGKSIYILEKRVNQFLGIRYAKAPVGHLRYKISKVIIKYAENIDAVEYGPSCYPIRLEVRDDFPSNTTDALESDRYSEDCLSLNIWSPCISETELNPVMVWFHGGGFLIGQEESPIYNGSFLAANGNVVVVSVNYRLGSLGFLNAGTKEESGNLGLYDQNLALNWIQDSIKYFNGDPNKVTLFGQEAGGISIGLHLTSRFSSNLFQRAIIQSGPPNMPLMLHNKKNALNVTYSFAKIVDCTTADNYTVANFANILCCLRSKSAEELVEAESNMVLLKRIRFKPIYDERFTTYCSINPLSPNKINNASLMIGVNKNEMNSLLYFFLPELFDPIKKVLNENESINALEDFFSKRASFEKSEELIKKFFGAVNESDEDQISKRFIHILTDFFFICPSIYFANLYSKQLNNVYFYFFTQETEKDNFELLYADWPGSFHGDEIQYVFGLPLSNLKTSNYTDNEQGFSKVIMGIWSSFAADGKPNFLNGKAPLYTKENPMVMNLNMKRSFQKHLSHTEHCMGIWRNNFFKGVT